MYTTLYTFTKNVQYCTHLHKNIQFCINLFSLQCQFYIDKVFKKKNLTLIIQYKLLIFLSFINFVESLNEIESTIRSVPIYHSKIKSTIIEGKKKHL